MDLYVMTSPIELVVSLVLCRVIYYGFMNLRIIVQSVETLSHTMTPSKKINYLNLPKDKHN